MYEILLVLFLVVSVALIGLILIQHGKGADMGASFGAGASGTVFGSAGSGNFLTRTTAVLATLFFVIALSLGYMVAHRDKSTEDIAAKIKAEADQKGQEKATKGIDELVPSVEDHASSTAVAPEADGTPPAATDSSEKSSADEPKADQKEQKSDDRKGS